MAGTPLTAEKRADIAARLAAGQSINRIVREVGTHRATVVRVKSEMDGGRLIEAAPPKATPFASPRLPDPVPAAGGPALPDPHPQSYEPFLMQSDGVVGVIGDTHLPFHDRRTIELFVDECRRRSVAAVLLNGDVLDCHEVSDHEKDRDAPSYVDEIEMGRQFLAWLRSRLPRARIVYKEGNHDYRTERYVFQRAPALAGLTGVNLPAFLQMADYGVEWVADKRVVMVGNLPVIHGHEYPGGGGVNPARWLYLRTGSSCGVNHFHRTSEHHERVLSQKVHGSFSFGCACYLHPKYRPLNQWNHGFAFVEVSAGGWYAVENKRVLDGRAV